MNFKKLEQFLKDNKQPAFRLKQIQKAVFEDVVSDFDEITVLPKDLREKIKKNFRILPFFAMPTGRQARNVLASKNKDSYKALLELEDGRVIETVLLNMKEGSWSVCVSSQAGCAMRCGFCATGAGGFFRNLTSEEIWGQVLFWKHFIRENKSSDQFQDLNYKAPDDRPFQATNQAVSNDTARTGAKKITTQMAFSNSKIANVVYMGMGEPFNNLENVFESIKVLIDKDAFGMGQRSISVSTCGILPGIEKFGAEFPQVNLAISLHAANDRLRSELMPVNKVYNLAKLADSLRKYFTKSKRQIFIEYILLDGVNDSIKHAKELADYLKIIGYRHLLHMNLIVFNPIKGALFKSSSKEQARKFKDFLIRNGISATIRKSLGQDIEGACGQLSARGKLSAG